MWGISTEFRITPTPTLTTLVGEIFLTFHRATIKGLILPLHRLLDLLNNLVLICNTYESIMLELVDVVHIHMYMFDV